MCVQRGVKRKKQLRLRWRRLPHPAQFCASTQELQALIKYIQMNKESDTDWFTIEPQDGGKSWKGKCW